MDGVNGWNISWSNWTRRLTITEEKQKEGKVLLEKSKKELEAKTSVLAEKAKQKKTTVKVEKKAPEFEEEGEITAEDLEFMPKEKTKPQPIEKIRTKKYISRNKAIEIADQEQNLRKSMYKEAKKAGYDYALIEIIDYCATLVMFQNKHACYVKISDATYNKLENSKYR